MCVLFFLLQAEDGIGDRVRSRGRGDVYKRQVFRRIGAAREQAGASLSDVVRTRVYLADIADFDAVGDVHGEVFGEIRPSIVILAVVGLAAPGLKAVSYTHLTLPTSDLV